MKKVLVTGGCGFIGSHIAEKLARDGHTVAVADNMIAGRPENVAGLDVSIYRCDILDESFQHAVDHFRPDCIVHEAAQTSVFKSTEDQEYDEAVNIQGTIHVIKAAHAYGVRKIVYAGSAAIYGEPVYLPIDEKHPIDPGSAYGISKYAAELYVRKIASEQYGIDYTILRYSNVYGPRQSHIGEGGVVAQFAEAFRTGRPLVVHGDGKQTRDFVFVKDVAEANSLALFAGSGEVLHVSTNTQTSINDLIRLMSELMGVQPAVRYAARRPNDIRDSALSNLRAAEKLGWRPGTLLREGLKRTLASLSM